MWPRESVLAREITYHTITMSWESIYCLRSTLTKVTTITTLPWVTKRECREHHWQRSDTGSASFGESRGKTRQSADMLEVPEHTFDSNVLLEIDWTTQQRVSANKQNEKRWEPHFSLGFTRISVVRQLWEKGVLGDRLAFSLGKPLLNDLETLLFCCLHD